MLKARHVLSGALAFVTPIVLVTASSQAPSSQKVITAMPFTDTSTTISAPITETPTTNPPISILCPGAPHPEQACLVPKVKHNHENQSPAAGTHQTSNFSSNSGGCSSSGPTPPDYIAQRESGGSYTARNPSGAGGKWQIMPSTLASLGGHGNAADLSPAQQDCFAAKLWNNGAGSSAWALTI